MDHKDYDELELMSLLVCLWRNAWKIVAAGILAAVLVFALMPKGTASQYESSGMLYLHRDEIAVDAQLVNGCVDILKAPAFQERIARLSGVPAEKLATVLTIKKGTGTDISIVTLMNTEAEAMSVTEAVVDCALQLLPGVAEGVTFTAVGDISIRCIDSSLTARAVKFAVLAAAAAVIFGAVIVCCAEVFDPRIRDERSAAAALKLPVLAVIPELPEDRKWKHCIPRKAFSRSVPEEYTEAYRTLRANLLFADRENAGRVFAVAASREEEDVYNLGVNLAAAFAAGGKKTVVADCALKERDLQSYLGMESTQGLSQLLCGRTNLDACLLKTETDGLWALCAGEADERAAELLVTDAMGETVDALRKRFDAVILIAPPVVDCADGAVVSALADGTLLAVRARFTKQEAVKYALQKLRSVNGNVLGVVLTRLNPGKLYSRVGYAQKRR